MSGNFKKSSIGTDKRKNSIHSNHTNPKSKSRQKSSPNKKENNSALNQFFLQEKKRNYERASFIPRSIRSSMTSHLSTKNQLKTHFNQNVNFKMANKNNLSNLYLQHSLHGSSLKMSKSVLLDLLSDKCNIEINLIQFVNPSIYFYDSFLNSLIFISKFHRGNIIMKSKNKGPTNLINQNNNSKGISLKKRRFEPVY
jgi:hypothetical protein